MANGIKNGIEERPVRSIVCFDAALVSLIVALGPISAVLDWAGTPRLLVIALCIAVGWAWPQPGEWPFNRIGRDRDA